MLRAVRRLAIPAALIVLAFGAGYAARHLGGPPAGGASASSRPAGNGDVNADGAIDIADPVFLLTYLFLGGEAPAAIASDEAASIVVLVRHAEKEASGDDPGLTPEGQARAAHLRDFLEEWKLDAVLATQYARTIATVQPAADARGLAVQSFAQVADIISAMRARPAGSSFLLAGNSFNIPQIASLLGVAEAIGVPSDEYDNMWIIRFPVIAGAPASLLHVRY